jgi:hypothetical protein
MAKTKARARAPQSSSTLEQPRPRTTRKQTLIDLMRVAEGATAAELGAAVGWQLHSVRGFIAGTLKKQPGLTVTAARTEGVTRYHVADAVSA